MTDDTGMTDPEAELDNAALAETLRALLREPSAADTAGVDPAQRAAEVRAAIQRAWPHGVPPAAEPGHPAGHDTHPAAAAPHDLPGPGHPGPHDLHPQPLPGHPPADHHPGDPGPHPDPHGAH
jgi:hypothetical protein